MPLQAGHCTLSNGSPYLKKGMKTKRTLSQTLQALTTGLLCCLLAACAEAELEYNDPYPANFIYRQVATKQALRSALESPGIYCMIHAEGKVYHFDNNYGQSDTDNMLGITGGQPYNSAGCGFIVGMTISTDMRTGQPQRVAYERACPHCDTFDNVTRPVEFQEKCSRYVVCPRCHRTYDLEVQGAAINGEGAIRLYKDRLAYDGMNNLRIYK